MSFATFQETPTKQPVSDSLTDSLKQLQELIDQEGGNHQEHVRKCKEMSDTIHRAIQQQIKKGDDKNQAVKLLKHLNIQNKRIKNMDVEEANEGTTLLEEQVDQVDLQIFHESVAERKQRLYNVHRNLSTVKGVFQSIAEVANQQVDGMFNIEKNISNAEEKGKKATQELLKSQQVQKNKLGWRIGVIVALVLIIILMLLK